MREPIDLAGDGLRGFVLAATAEGLGSRHNLLKSSPPENREDGWLTARSRSGEHDWAIIRLGVPGVVEEVVIDTSHFQSDYPPVVSVEGCTAAHNSDPAELTDWVELASSSDIKGDSENRLQVAAQSRVSHLRVNLSPDGGIARIRVMGQPIPNWMAPGFPQPRQMDLVACRNGGHVHSVSNEDFGSVKNLVRPGLEGSWVSARRRDGGHDWAVLRLVGPGTIESLILDTKGLSGDSPQKARVEGSCALDPGDDDWFELLSEQRILPHTEHMFTTELADNSEVLWVRLNLLPDGGMTRFYALGQLSESGFEAARLLYLNSAPEQSLKPIFKQVCHSKKWVDGMAASAPFSGLNDLLKKGARAWSKCAEPDWKEALDGHPRIGQKAKGSSLSARWSKGEQSKAAVPEPTVVEQLLAEQEAYYQKFGFIFLICATGKSSQEILKSVQKRLGHSVAEELQTVAEEQAKIIHLRLEKLLKS